MLLFSVSASGTANIKNQNSLKNTILIKFESKISIERITGVYVWKNKVLRKKE
ncbi:hypothetical protein OENI_60086 [Oenococcus oeni]|nr:hypothetical protein OENI_60086 [Oenococcus oeni]